MEEVLRLKLPWALLRDKLVASDEQGNILYMSSLEGYKFDSAVPQVSVFSVLSFPSRLGTIIKASTAAIFNL